MNEYTYVQVARVSDYIDGNVVTNRFVYLIRLNECMIGRYGVYALDSTLRALFPAWTPDKSTGFFAPTAFLVLAFLSAVVVTLLFFAFAAGVAAAAAAVARSLA